MTDRASTLRCWLVGHETLALRCAQAWCERGHWIAGVTTRDPRLAQWAEERGLPVTSSAAEEEILAHTQPDGIDYLFSVVNDEIIGSELLAAPRVCALNYHDGPLPRHAGVHSTTWALIEGEVVHGVTWHGMVSRFDAGPILHQRQVTIDPDETAFTLNLKCHQAGLETFVMLLDEIDAGRSHDWTPQDLSLRNVWSRFRRPAGALLIAWDRPAAELARLSRAVNFGSHPNRFGSLRIWTGERLLIAEQCVVAQTCSNQLPGTVVQTDVPTLVVSTASGDLEVGRLFDLDGSPVRSGPALGSTLPTLPDPDRDRLTAALAAALRNESFWVDCLSRFPAAQLPEAYANGTQDSEEGHAGYACAAPHGGLTGTRVAAAFAAFWTRSGIEGGFRIAYRDEGGAIPAPSPHGICASWVPVSVDLDGTETLGEACGRVSDAIEGFGQLGAYLRDLPLRYPEPLNTSTGDIACEITPEPDRAPVEPLSSVTLRVSSDGDGIKLWCNRSVITEVGARRLALRFEHFLAATVDAPDTALTAVSLLDEAERRNVLYTWNATQVNRPPELTVLQLIEQQVRRRPDAVAVRCGSTRLTYREFAEQANQLASYLQQEGVEPGEMVAVFVDRSIEMVVGILAVLRMGGAYLPLDPIHPDPRLAKLVADSQPRFVISEGSLCARLPAGLRRILIDRDAAAIRAAPRRAAFAQASPDHLAYRIYTSGSTGEPRGVSIEHRSLVNLVLGYAERSGFSESDTLYAFTSIGFDWSVLDLFLPLAHGACLEILGADVTRDGGRLAEAVESGDVTFMQGTPGAWRLMLAGGWKAKQGLTIVSGGETLSPELAAQILERVDRLHNIYGPTETTVVTSMEPIFADTAINIGTPLPNCRHYILDPDLQPMAVGEVGEICIGGDCVSPGYHNRGGADAARFTLDPYVEGARLYRSGDLGRFCADGRIEFVGRRDFQVKLNGVRIELAEIES
jgi:polyketide synthase PksN